MSICFRLLSALLLPSSQSITPSGKASFNLLKPVPPEDLHGQQGQQRQRQVQAAIGGRLVTANGALDHAVLLHPDFGM